MRAFALPTRGPIYSLPACAVHPWPHDNAACLCCPPAAPSTCCLPVLPTLGLMIMLPACAAQSCFPLTCCSTPPRSPSHSVDWGPRRAQPPRQAPWNVGPGKRSPTKQAILDDLYSHASAHLDGRKPWEAEGKAVRRCRTMVKCVRTLAFAPECLWCPFSTKQLAHLGRICVLHLCARPMRWAPLHVCPVMLELGPTNPKPHILKPGSPGRL